MWRFAIAVPLYKGLPLSSLLRKIYFLHCYLFRVALADKSMKLRILIIYMFRSYSHRGRRVSFFFRMVYLSSRYNLGLNVLCHAISFR